jgi:hypothetical protein
MSSRFEEAARRAREVPIVRGTNYPYTLRYGWRWVVTSRTLLTALRCFYWAIIRGHDGETCWFCGRPYPLWWAPDDLWAEFSGNSGLCCPSCFDARAKKRGVWLRWRPERA